MGEKKHRKKFSVTKKPDYREEKSVSMTLRLDKKLQQQFEDLSYKTDYSRNALMCMALAYAMENLEFIEN